MESELDLEIIVKGLSDSQKAVLGAEGLGPALAAAAPNTRKALEARGLIHTDILEGGLILTETGAALRGVLLQSSMGEAESSPERDPSQSGDQTEDHSPEPDPSRSGDQSKQAWSQADHLCDLVSTAELIAPRIDAGELDLEEITGDAVLAGLIEGAYRAPGDGERASVAAIFDEGRIFEGALHGAYAMVFRLDLEEGGGAEMIDMLDLHDMFLVQWKADQRLPAETLFRLHRDGADWPDCPKWLEVFLETFGGVVHALKPLARRDRAAIEARLRDLQRERRTKGLRRRQAEKVIRRRERRAARPGKLAEAKAAREKRRSPTAAQE